MLECKYHKESKSLEEKMFSEGSEEELERAKEVVNGYFKNEELADQFFREVQARATDKKVK